MGSIDNSATPALASSPRVIFFTDFDGTITTQDSNDHITDTLGFGAAERRKLNESVLIGNLAFREAFTKMLESVSAKAGFQQCVEMLLEAVRLDPKFKEFWEWSKAANVPVVILSGGMKPIIEALLVKFLGKEDVEKLWIVSNDVEEIKGKGGINEVGGWRIVFHDESIHGHDKSREIRKYSSLPERPVLLYAGDGVSDLSAARETDLMFAKAGRDLVTYCKHEKIPYNEFSDFSTILETARAVHDGKISVQDAAAKAVV